MWKVKEMDQELESSLLLEEDGIYNIARERESNCSDDDTAITAIAIFSAFIAVLGSFCYGLAAGFTSSAEAGIMQDLGLSIAEDSVFGSMMSIGATLGALFCGPIADHRGRKGANNVAGGLVQHQWMASSIFAKGALLLDIGRLSVGLGVALQCYVAPVYIGEVTPKSIRGACSFANQLMVTLGMSLMYFVGNLIHWRILAAIGIVPCVLQVFGMFFIPESPRWLANIGDEKGTETTLQRLRGANADISKEADEIRVIPQ